MLYYTEDYSDSGLCPSFGIAKTTRRFGNWLYYRPRDSPFRHTRLRTRPSTLRPVEGVLS